MRRHLKSLLVEREDLKADLADMQRRLSGQPFSKSPVEACPERIAMFKVALAVIDEEIASLEAKKARKSQRKNQ